MSDAVGKPEIVTQRRIIALFKDDLGYKYLGDWSDRANNSNVEEDLLSAWLARQGYSAGQITKAIRDLKEEARNPSRSLYENNKAVYDRLRYGIDVKPELGEAAQKVKFINFDEPDKNDFAIAEEVTLSGENDRRPDLVLYVNGIALGVIELKNSRVSIGNGIRQNLSNQQSDFHPWFFSTVQYVFAGNDSEGLKYGTILTPEKFFLPWKEDEHDNAGFKVDKYLRKMCEKSRFLEIIRDFVLFDNGVKKLPRPHQYFAVKKAQIKVAEKKGGIIWHTQGSGKSIVMVLLAKWILENYPNARVLVVTDRDELDKQIEGVFNAVGEGVKRTTSGRDLLRQLGQANPRLLCSLVHKFGPRDVDNFEAFIKELGDKPSATIGDVFVFVDECHRTQSGKLHRSMRAIMPDSVLVGFTGTPLLKKDSATTLSVFGDYISTYNFKEAVADKVVLDLVYESRDVDQRLRSPERIDQWFEKKTSGLNQWKKNEIKKYWSTRQKVLSSRARSQQIINDIVYDFSTIKRLDERLGNAILVATSIYEACRYFKMLQETSLKGQCALVTSYNPLVRDITLEETGANTETEKQFTFSTYTELLNAVTARPGKSKTETYEDEAKAKFVKDPANMRLLVVVDKLLTGFDAPPCSVLYIDKNMQDHGLFQAICRTNRLDDESKTVGSIIDYKNLLQKVHGAMAVYTSELDHTGSTSPEVLVADRLSGGRDRLNDARETLYHLCEQVAPPGGELEVLQYFCGNSEIASDLKDTEPRRIALYRATVNFMRGIADLADDMDGAGYSPSDIVEIHRLRDHYLNIREIVRRASGETLDLKPYEADMRYLIDTYIEADSAKMVFSSGNTGLLELIEQLGVEKAVEGYFGVKVVNREIVAATIENNIRKKLIKDHLADPAYFEEMSALLQEVIDARKAKAIEYQAYLRRIGEIAKQANAGKLDTTPVRLDTPGKRALWNALAQDEDLALRLDAAIREGRKDGWRGNLTKERELKGVAYSLLMNEEQVERIFRIIKAQTEY